VTVAVTGMVVLAFLVPLFILVSDLARDSAINTAERDAESLARVLSVLSAQGDVDTAIDVVGSSRVAEIGGTVVLPDGTVFGAPMPDGEDLSLAQEGSSFVAAVDEGAAVYVPVLTTDGSTAVVRVFVPQEVLDAGVRRSWLILALLGLALVVIAAWVADRLGRSMVVPVKELSDTANKLGHGDLSARVEPSGPPEIEEVGVEINRLAGRIGRLLQEERETAADLAHRLRTPLTSARLTVDGIEDGTQKDRLVADLDELQRTTDFIIREARRPVRREQEEWCDFAVVAKARWAFWQPLVEEQTRTATDGVTEVSAPVALPAGDAEAVVDALIENALSHTVDGTRIDLSVDVMDGEVVFCIEDAGEGFVDGSAIERGASQGDSTGLGLDIVRRTVEDAQGTLALGESRALGGAGVVVRLPLARGR
jgi:signal transduction histidine kinase